MNRIELHTITRFTAWPLWSGLALLALTGAARAQFYAVTDLGTLGGTNGMAYGINNHEQIVGAAQTAVGNYHGFVFDGGRMIDLGTMGGSNSWAHGINDNGWMVGGAEMPATNMHAFVCTNALTNPVMIDLGTMGGSNSAAWMINMHGEMVGWAAMTNGSHHAFFMTNFTMGGMMDLGTAGGTNSEAYCINSNRMVVGYAMMSDGTTEPIMSTNALMGSGSMMTMGMGGMGASGGESWFVNNLGQTSGQAQMAGGNQHAFVSGGGGMMGSMNVDLGTLGGTNSFAYCISDAGNVVGMAGMNNGGYHAFMVTNALGGMVQMMDLNALIPTNSGWELMTGRGMNASGQIIGWGMHAGRTNAFLLTPVSAPVMMMSAPSPQIVGPGAQVTLQMQMSASEPLTYQWLHDGMAIPGATNATLTLPAMSMGNAGQYTVTARNAVGTVGRGSAAVGMFSMQFTNGTAHLAVAGPAGTHFSIDYSDMLAAGSNWQTMTNFTMMGSMSRMSDTPPPGSHARFYRAAMLP
jgi:probable HAF family extracellular repeat protein